MRKSLVELNDMLVLIPAYNPDEKLLQYVKGLIENQITNILVVDDGSRRECQQIFDQLETQYGIVVLHHPVNRGKGRALKTGFQWCMQQLPHCHGVVTADCDGQHSPKDTRRVLEVLGELTEGLVLGTRDFNIEQVPFKSSFGNKLTSVVFKLLYGRFLCDTQTGLRGITWNYLQEFWELAGERYEYEIKMLILAARKNIEICEVTIETIYLEENKETHFRPVRDSMRIYGVMFSTFLKYLLSSVSTSLLDIGIFALLNVLLLVNLPTNANVWISTIVARIISSVCNYLINRRIVFGSEENAYKTMIQYSGLVVLQMMASAGLVYLFTLLLSWSAVLVKVIVDSCLFLVSFQVQQRLIFKK